MRRLPEGRKPLFAYVLRAPVRYMVYGAMLCAVLLGVYYIIWRFITPESCCRFEEGQTMLELKNITKVYGKKAALQDVSVAFAPGQIVGLFGEKRRGKDHADEVHPGPHRSQGGGDPGRGRPSAAATSRGSAFATCEHSFFPRLSPKAHSGSSTGSISPGSTINALRL